MPNGKAIVIEEKKTDYHSFINKKLPEIKQQQPSLSAKEAYQIAREEWKQTKTQTPMVKKPRGRPKKIQDDSDDLSIGSNKSNTSNGKRGRPPKNPLMNHLDTFEIFLKKSTQWENEKPQKEMMEELDIDEDTLLLYFKHLDPESELRQLLERKNAPKKSRGRPKGSKNKNNQNIPEKEMVIETPPEVIQFNQNLDSLFQKIENS